MKALSPQVAFLTAFLATTVAAAVVAAQSPSVRLAPTGTLRALFLGGNPVQGQVDRKTGAMSGTVPDLARELARRIGVPLDLKSAPDASTVIASLSAGTADIGFLAYDELRAREVDFGPAFVVMANSYLVRSTSPIRANSDIDRAGVTVAAVRGQTQEHFVSSTMKQAGVRVFAAMPAQGEVEKLLASGTIDAFAVNRQRALEAERASAGTLRALPDSFLDVDQSIVVAKGNSAALQAVEPLVEEMRTSGFIRLSIERARLVGVSVAPSRKR